MDLSETGILEENTSLQLVLAEYRKLELAAAEERTEERKRAKQMPTGEPVARLAESDDASTEEDQSKSKGDSQNSKSESSLDDRWLDRINSVEGVPDEELSSVHGQLIAWGFLRVKVLSRTSTGYQLTNLGKQAAEDRLPDENPVEVPAEAA